MPAFSNTVMELGGTMARRLTTRAAAEQGGIISGDNPTAFNTADPIRLWIIQVGLIIVVTQLLSIPFARIRQPRVIAEVIAGILLGPTAMGRIPHFSARIFPPQSLPYLNLTATIGLVLFLFLIGLEVDTRILRRNARTSLAVSAAGIVLPFGLGVAAAVPIYNKFVDSDKVSFGHFMLFTGVAISITAFPVLCRILTETKLLDTTVGVIVLAAGVGNDVVGWVLLALTVALVNASTGLTALYVLLATVGGTLVLMFPVRWGFVWLAHRTGSIERGQPTPFMVTATLLLVFASAFFTDVIGVHAIFGGFLAGLIIPHEGGFAIALVEKIEDIVTVLLIPIYFTLSGLKTDFTTLNSGIAWGYTIMLVVIAFVGKFLGCAAAAKYSGFNIRESGAIGALMSCKGLVELIVLNIGLQAGILDTRVFSMFVIMALILTLITTPLTLWIYPAQHRVSIGSNTTEQRGLQGDANEAALSRNVDHTGFKTKFTVILNKIEHLPSLMALVQILQPPSNGARLSLISTNSDSADPEKEDYKEKGPATPRLGPNRNADGTPYVSIDALRLIELTDRTSAVMQSSEADDLLQRDPLINVFRTFGNLNRIPVSSALSVVQKDSFPSSVAIRARDTNSDMVIIPWTSRASALEDASNTGATPFDGVFGRGGTDRQSSTMYTHFIRRTFIESTSDVAVFIDRGVNSVLSVGQHIYFPFFGGPDDRLALNFVVQLCVHPDTTATVVRVKKTGSDLTPIQTNETEDPKLKDTLASFAANLTVQSTTGAFPDTIYPAHTDQSRMASQAADDVAWEAVANPNANAPHRPANEAALTRIKFTSIASPTPLQAIIQNVATETAEAKQQDKSLLVIVGRARRLAVESHADEMGKMQLSAGDLRKTVGDVATAVMSTGAHSLLVMQEANCIA